MATRIATPGFLWTSDFYAEAADSRPIIGSGFCRNLDRMAKKTRSRPVRKHHGGRMHPMPHSPPARTGGPSEEHVPEALQNPLAEHLHRTEDQKRGASIKADILHSNPDQASGSSRRRL